MEKARKILNIYPLTPLQSGLLFRAIYDQNTDEYVVQCVLHLDSVNAEAMKLAWNNIITQHDILRTGFTHYSSKEPVQYVFSTAEVPFFVHDYSDDSNKEARLEEFVLNDRKQVFDLSIAPLMRVNLVKLDEDQFVMLWTFHHILLDGWSVAIVLDELFSVYRDILSNNKSELHHRRSYRDYVAWLRKQNTNKAILFWKNYLSNIEESSLLSFDDVKSEGIDYCSEFYEISENLTEKILKLCKKYNLTLNTVLIGAVGMVLQRYLGRKDVIVGMTTSGRDINLAGIEDMVGLFIHTLPVIMPKNKNFLSYFNELQENILLINENAYISLADIQNCSSIRGTLFNVHFVLENYPVSTLTDDDCIKIRKLDTIERVEYPLTITSCIVNKGLIFRFGFQTKCFSKAIISNIFNSFKGILESIIENEEKNIFEVVINEEKSKQLTDWNATDSEYPQNVSMHQLFEKQVDKSPDAIAVIHENNYLTYRQLNNQSNQLAHYLRERGVKDNDLVAIYAERSLEMVVGVIGVLKSGGVYVPLNPTYPEERLKYMLKDTGAKILLTQNHLQEKVRSFIDSNVIVICLDNNEEIKLQSMENLPEVKSPQNLAYIIYTSGSTGRPKGVAINHDSAINTIHAINCKFNVDKTDSVLAVSELSFDLSVYDIFGLLFVGGKIVFPKQELFKDMGYLSELIRKYRVTIWNTVPQLADLISDKFEEIPNDSIRLFLLSGDKIDLHLPTKLNKNFSIAEVYSLGGATEGSIWSIWYEVTTVKSEWNSIPYGIPMPNQKIYVLTEDLEPCDIGVKGEICIGGIGVAVGYWNNEELTNQRFINHARLGRLYKTGDCGCWNRAGYVEFLGRMDNQVKIRGFRIELGEIESVINECTGVDASVALAKQSEDGNKYLVSYIIPKYTRNFDEFYEIKTQTGEVVRVFTGEKIATLVEDVRNYIEQTLPEYMVPSFFVVLDKIPLTTNGKRDTKLLLSLKTGSILNLSEYVAPRNEIEKKLCDIWKKVLHIDQVSINDNFFRIGGHSLLAMKVISQIRSELKVELPLKKVFEHTTIAELAGDLRGSVSEIPPLAVQKRPELIPLSFAQQRLWILDKLLPGKSSYNIPYSMKLKGQLDYKKLEKAISKLIERHESFRTNFLETKEGAGYQVIDLCSKFTLITEEISEEQVREVMKEEAEKPFNLAKDRLLRVRLLKLNDREHFLLITMHHIISDGWSMAVFLNELVELYNDENVVLSKLPISYVDYTLWQRGWLGDQILSNQLNYWKDHLREIPKQIELPYDYQRPAEMTYEGGRVNFVLEKTIYDGIVELAKKTNTTTFMVIFAAMNCLLHKYTHQKDIIIGTPVANRHYQETEGLIGFFANTLALRTHFNERMTFKEVLNQVKKSVLSGYENQDIPFEYLVDQLNIERQLNVNPLFQVMVTINKGEVHRKSFDGLKENQVFEDYSVSKFDLEIDVQEEEGGCYFLLGYSKELFKEETITRMSKHIIKLLKKIIKNPEQQLRQIEILSNEEKNQLLVEWNNTKANCPFTKCIHELFEEQVVNTPDSIAVVFEDKQLTYEELNARANQLAHYLRKRGVKSETLVALCVERSLDMLIGILGILKAGGAYVPLDPSYPEDRLRYMLEDTGADILLTQKSLENIICKFVNSKINIIKLDSDWDKIAEESVQNLEKNTHSLNLAYIIYTSGSTGRPKGAQLNHMGAINHLFIKIRDAELSRDSIVAQTAKLSFDISVWQNLSAIISGGRTLIIKDEDVLDVHNLLDIVCSTQVSVLELVPTLFSELIDIIDNRNLYKVKDIKFLFVTGEALKNSLCKKWISLVGDDNIPIVNAYGPTECSDDITHYFVRNFADISETEITSVGHSLSNLVVVVLDKDLNIVPIGVTGEICVYGVGVGRGYLNRPDVTANTFVANPFGDGDRLYKTGDLGKYRSDGNIEFLGRIDNQVKIRGFRIELGEIESVISAYSEIKTSVVLPRTLNNKDKVLVAYIVPKFTQGLNKVQTQISYTTGEISIFSDSNTSELIDNVIHHILLRLPEYMVPSEFIVIDKIPTLPNGKIDSGFLMNLKGVKKQNNENYVPPRNETERKICDIWKSVLNLEKVGINDNFFKVGGDSIKAIQVTSIMRQNNLFIAVKDLFLHQEISKLAAVVSSNDSVLNAVSVKNLDQVVVDDKVLKRYGIDGDNLEDLYPLSHLQEGILFHCLLSDDDSYVIQSIFHLSSIDVDKLSMAWNVVVSKHDTLRSGVLWDGVEKNIAYVLKNAEVPVNRYDWTDVTQEERDRLNSFIREDRRKGFDFSNPPLMRVSLIQTDENKFIMIWSFHSIFLDGWSSSAILTEVFQTYQSMLNNEVVQLKNREPYKRYIEWLYAQDNKTAKQFWRDYFQGLNTASHLSFKGAVDKCSVDYADKTYILSIDETRALRKFAKKHAITMNTIFCGVIGLILQNFLMKKDVVFGVVTSGRSITLPHIEEMVGLFLNTLPIRVIREDSDKVIDYLTKLQTNIQTANEYGYISLSDIQNCSKVGRDLFNILFIYDNYPVDNSIYDSGIKISDSYGIERISYPLTISSYDTHENELAFRFSYKTEDFDESIIEKLYQQLLYMLKTILKGENVNIRKISEGSLHEKQELLRDLDLTTIVEEDRDVNEDYVPPQTDIEQKLCEIWEKALDIDRVGITDNFFKIGGNSITAIRIISRIRSLLNIKVPLKNIFEYPTITEFLKNIKMSDSRELPPLVFQDKSGNIPLSFAQQRLWIIDKFALEKTLYNLSFATRIYGSLNYGALEKAVNYLIDRHESFRTNFAVAENMEVYQVISKDSHIDLKIIDTEESKINQLVTVESETPFDLERDRLIRFSVLRISDNDNVLLITMHHIISDGWSMPILLQELEKLYEAYATGADITLRKLPITYADYAIWQKSWLRGEVLNNQLGYWKDHLRGSSYYLNLPLDYSRPTEMSYAGETYRFTLSLDTYRAILRLSEKNNVTVFMIILAAVNCLMYKYTSQEDIIIGTPVANRQYKETEGVIGFFANMLALRTNLHSKDTFLDILNKVKDAVLAGYEHQDIPFEYLVEHINVQRHLNINPLFQVVVLALKEEKTSAFAGLAQRELTLESHVSKFDLTIAAIETSGNLDFSIEYSVELFRRDTIKQLAKHLCNFLDRVLLNENQKLSSIDILSSSEKQQLLEKWNNVKIDDLSSQCIHELFEEQVTNAPDSIAVVFEDKQLTYKELNARANQLAHYLRKRGVKSETLVALCVERSLDMLVGILGILKAGGAYVPLDPSYPEDRLKYMLEDTGTNIVVTQGSLESRLNKLCGLIGAEIDIIRLDSDWDKIAIESVENPETNMNSLNLAYIIYTSGSTGRPKGVQIPHNNVIKLMDATSLRFDFHRSDVWSCFHSYAFDFSVWEMFGAILFGAKVVLVSYEKSRYTDEFCKYISEQDITLLSQTPSAFYQLIDNSKNIDLSSLRYVVFGGEALDFSRLRSWYRYHGSSTKLVNMYGITETTVHSTYFMLNEKDISSLSIIGNKLDDLTLYILDDNMNNLPVGVYGEIYIGGRGLSRGYLNRPDLTAERFVASPFGEGERLYKTGDVARYLQDGNIEYLGRKDSQVKIRGFRIELGEIENVINSCKKVQSSVVCVKSGEQDDDKRLIAYIVPSETDTLEVVEVREGLFKYVGNKVVELINDVRSKIMGMLPNYCIPSAFIMINKIPVTNNGKVDGKLLLSLDTDQRFLSEEYVAPRTELEKHICQIWESVLKMENIGIDDDFFKIGGSSLTAIKMLNKINREIASNVKAVDVFMNSTIRSFAAFISSVKKSRSILVEFNSNSEKAVLFMVHPSGYGCEVYKDLADKLKDNYWCWGIDSYNMYADTKITCLNELAAYYVSKIEEKFDLYNMSEIKFLGWSLGGQIAMEMSAILEKKGLENIKILLLDTVVCDDFMLDTDLDKDEIRKMLQSMDAEIGDVSNLIDVMFIDEKMHCQNICSKLKHTEVTLIKAMQLPPFVNSKDDHLNKHILMLESNNIELWLEDTATLKVVNLHTAHHKNIVEKMPESSLLGF